MTAAHEFAECLRALAKLEARYGPMVEADAIDPQFIDFLLAMTARFLIGSKEYGTDQSSPRLSRNLRPCWFSI